MRAGRYHGTGAPDVPRVEDADRPAPEDDEGLIEIGTASVNHLDTLFRAGIDMFGPGTFPTIPGSDFAGTVEAVGDDETDFEAWDRILGAGLAGSPMGSYAEYTVASTSLIGHLPDEVGFEEGAIIGHVGVTTKREFDIEVLAKGGIEFTGEEGGLANVSQFHTRLGVSTVDVLITGTRAATVIGLGVEDPRIVGGTYAVSDAFYIA